MIRRLIISMIMILGLVLLVNADVPVFNPIPAQTLVENSGTSPALDLSQYVTDADNTTHIFNIIQEDTNKVNCEISGESVTFTPFTDFVGDANCTIQVYDGNATDTQTVDITVEEENPDFLDIGTVVIEDADTNTTRTKTFSLENIGNVDFSNIIIRFVGDSKYNVTFDPASIASLNVGDSESVELTVYIPSDEPSGTRTIGTVDIESDQTNESFNLELDVRSKLEISDLEVEIDGDTEDKLNDGDKITNKAEPEDKVYFVVTIENRYTDTEDIDIEDIQVIITVESIDDGDDIELESSEFDLEADKEEDIILDFDVPLKVDEGDYDVVIEVEGEDDNGNIHRDEWRVKLSVEKKSHYVKIQEARLSPTSIECNRRINIFVEFMNVGSKDEDEVELEIKNTNIGLNIRKQRIQLDNEIDEEENIYEETFTFTVADNVPAGSYPIKVSSFYSEDILSDIKTLQLDVKDCTRLPPEPEIEEEEETIEEQTAIEEEQETPETGITIQQPPTSKPKESKTFRDTHVYIALVVLALITVVGAILIIIGYVILKKK